MSKLVLVFLVIFTLNYSLIGAIISSKENSFSARQMGQTLAQCFVEKEICNCFENKISETLDKAIANNETWQLSDFLVIEKNTNNSNVGLSGNDNSINLLNLKQQRSDKDPLSVTLALKLLQLAQMRSLRLQLPSSTVRKLLYQLGISSALDDFNANANDGETDADDDATKQEEGRKKKHKDKNMAMLGGMAMLAMVAQMFLSKVIVIAGAAFIMAKVALLISALGSLKGGTSGSEAGKDHVIVTGGAARGRHNHEHISSWHRRSLYEKRKVDVISSHEHKFPNPVSYYGVTENSIYKLQNQHQKPPIKNDLNKVYL